MEKQNKQKKAHLQLCFYGTIQINTDVISASHKVLEEKCRVCFKTGLFLDQFLSFLQYIVVFVTFC